MENTYKRKLQRAEEIIGAIKAGEKDAHLLQTEPDSAFLIIRETTYDEEDVAIEYSLSLLRGDRYTASRHLSSKPIPFFRTTATRFLLREKRGIPSVNIAGVDSFGEFQVSHSPLTLEARPEGIVLLRSSQLAGRHPLSVAFCGFRFSQWPTLAIDRQKAI
jgi:hypothetical protein